MPSPKDCERKSGLSNEKVGLRPTFEVDFRLSCACGPYGNRAGTIAISPSPSRALSRRTDPIPALEQQVVRAYALGKRLRLVAAGDPALGPRLGFLGPPAQA